MNHPTGPCPVCSQPLTEADDVVICPECGAPYHRACYAKEGHCLYAGQHGKGFEYHAPDAGPAKDAGAPSDAADPQKDAGKAGRADGSARGVRCPQCGTINDGDTIFCVRCGSPLHGTQPPPQGAGWAGGGFGGFGGTGYAPPMDLSGEIDDIPKRDWATFIGKSAPVYLQRLSAMQSRGTKISVLFSAFLVSPYYFAYRKMWGWAVCALGIFLLLMMPTVFLDMADLGHVVFSWLPIETLEVITVAASYLSLVARVMFGLFALHLYRRDAGAKISMLREQHSNEADYQAAIEKKGGVSIPGAVAVGVAYLAFSVLVFFLLGDQAMAAMYMLV